MLFLLFVSAIGRTWGVDNPVEYVDILGGTDSRYDLSHGNVLPLVARPWGFNSWSPMTTTSEGSWWFHPYDVSFYGIRCTHQPSPWISDYGQFTVTANIVDPKHNDIHQFSSFNPKETVYSPYFYKVSLLAYGTLESYTSLELTSTSHGAIIKVTFPPHEENSDFNQTRRILIGLNGGNDSSQITTLSDGAIGITGVSTANSGGVPSQEKFGHKFAIGIYAGDDGDKPLTSEFILSSNSNNEAAWIDLHPDSMTDTLSLRIATSFISSEQALLNMQHEVPVGVTFDDTLRASKSEWNEVLLRANVMSLHSSYTSNEVNSILTTFYSSLYRASLFPRQLSEMDESGNIVHWSPFVDSSEVFIGPLSTDSGFWDAYSTVYPLLSLVNVPALSTTLQGWVNAYKEGGWLPKWASPGYRGSMVGTMGDVSIADAIVKKIPGFDVQTAYEAICKDAYEPPEKPSEGMGRECLQSYIKFGYIPHSEACSEVVSRTLDYYQSDFAISKAAEAVGDYDTATSLRNRAANYSLLFDFSTGFMRSRKAASGKFTEPFDEFAWGGDYTEAGPWQYRFSIPYDAPGLAELYADAKLDMCAMLDQTQTMASVYHLGDYSSQIHEMTEMAVNCWGQYEHNNQPVHHMLYMFGSVDPSAGVTGVCAAKGQYYLRKAMRDLYNPTWDMFSGDEDNGEMGAWYVLTSIGLYSLSPGTDDYVFGSPLFERVVINIDGAPGASQSPELIIEAKNNSAENVYVQSVSWNGQDVVTNAINYSELMKGGTLTFHMGVEPLAP